MILNIRQINQIIIVLLTLPLPLFYILESKQKILHFVKIIKDKFKSKENVAEVGQVQTGEIDESKRKFLKIAAGTSLATAIMMFVNRKSVGAAFFGSVPGPGTVAVKDIKGNKVDPAQRQPLDGYNISDIDDGGIIRYFGFINKDGGWYVLQEDTLNNTIRYRVGDTGYVAAWGARTTGAPYGLFNDVF